MSNRTNRRRGRADQRARAALAPLVATGLAVCWRCGHTISWLDHWDAGHLHDLATGGHPDGPRAPEHTSCNRSAGATLGKQLRTESAPRRRMTEWL